MPTSKPDEIAIEALNVITTTSLDVQEKYDQVVPDDDDSSIEALAWTDFTDDELEIAKELAEKEFPSTGNKEHPQQTDETEENLNIVHSAESQTSEESASSKCNDEFDRNSVLSISTTSQTLLLSTNEEEDIAIINYSDNKEGNHHQEEESDNLVPSSVSNCEDKSSNAPVLDDGPIWGKGAKLYKFQENQRINHKLSVAVLASVVLAIGIGLGNLVAYNEYEGEYKPVDQQQQHCPTQSLQSPPVSYNQIPASPSDDPTVAIQNGKPVLPLSYEIIINRGKPSLVWYYTRSGAAYSYFDYIVKSTAKSSISSIHTLAHVVKSIDELSKKIDQFNNTTRQLSGIMVMKDDLKKSKASFHSYSEKNSHFGSEEELSQLLPTFNDGLLNKKNTWQNKFDGTMHHKSKKRGDFHERKVPKNPSLKNQLVHKAKHHHEKVKETSDVVCLGEKKRKSQIRVKKANDKPMDKKIENELRENSKTLTSEKLANPPKQMNDETQRRKKDVKRDETTMGEQESKKDEYKFENVKKQRKSNRGKSIDTFDTEHEQLNKKKDQQYQPNVRKSEHKNTKYNGMEMSIQFENQQNVLIKSEEKYYEKGYKVKKYENSANKGETKFVSDEHRSIYSFSASENFPEKLGNGENANKKGKTNLKKQSNVDERNSGQIDSKPKLHKQFDENNDKNGNNGHKKFKPSNYKIKNDDKDWAGERARTRESNRVYKNWNSDFNAEVKRNSWQIERDRLREKIRKRDD